MTFQVGFHVLDESLADPGGACTCMDSVGAMVAAKATERAVRVYSKSRLAPALMAKMADLWTSKGYRVLCLNEPNLPLEGFGGGPAEYAAWFLEVANLAPTARLYYAGISPGLDGWHDYYTHPLARQAIQRAAGVCVHTYGDLYQLVDTAAWILANTPAGKPCWVSEWNFGAGRKVDVNAWAPANVPPFLNWCAEQPRIEGATWFAWTWPRPDMGLPTPVDAKGTAIETAIRKWRPPVPVPAPITRSQVLVNAATYEGVPYVWGADDPPNGLDCSAFVCRCWAVPRRGTDTIGEFCAPIAKWDLKAGDAMNLTTQADPGGSGHIRLFERWADPNHWTCWVWEETTGVTPGRVVHRTVAYDPHYQPVRRTNIEEDAVPNPPIQPDAIAKLRDQAWAVAEQFEQAGQPWTGQGIKAIVALSKGEK